MMPSEYVYTFPSNGQGGYFSYSAISPETTQFQMVELPFVGSTAISDIGANISASIDDALQATARSAGEGAVEGLWKVTGGTLVLLGVIYLLHQKKII